METIPDFDHLVKALLRRGARKKAAIVWACDSTTRHAVGSALAEGFIDAIFIGCRADVEADPMIMSHADHVSIIDVPDSDAAAAKAVELARDGKADIIMKGMLNTDNLLRPMLNKTTGILPAGATLTHITAAQIPSYGKLLLFSDAAVIPYPTPEQRKQQVAYAARMAREMGVAQPRIALIHCSEKVDERHFPFTASYPELAKMAEEGMFGNCIVDGPLDVKTSCSKAALDKKGLTSPVDGYADAIIFPDIEAANAFYKTITLFCEASTAGLLMGAMVPVVLPSRGDSVRSKFYSLTLASLLN